VSGTDFRAVDEVLINNQPVSDFVVVSKTKLLVTVPDTLQNDNLVSLVVLSRRLTVTARSLLRFRLGKKPGRVSGILRLVQLYLKVLFTTQGTDIWNTSDEFHFAYKELSGAGAIIARVESVGNTDPWAKAWLPNARESATRAKRARSARVAA